MQMMEVVVQVVVKREDSHQKGSMISETMVACLCLALKELHLSAVDGVAKE